MLIFVLRIALLFTLQVNHIWSFITYIEPRIPLLVSSYASFPMFFEANIAQLNVKNQGLLEFYFKKNIQTKLLYLLQT